MKVTVHVPDGVLVLVDNVEFEQGDVLAVFREDGNLLEKLRNFFQLLDKEKYSITEDELVQLSSYHHVYKKNGSYFIQEFDLI